MIQCLASDFKSHGNFVNMLLMLEIREPKVTAACDCAVLSREAACEGMRGQLPGWQQTFLFWFNYGEKKFIWVFIWLSGERHFGARAEAGAWEFQILCPLDLSFAPSKTTVLFFLHVILGEFLRSRHSFNTVSAEMLLLLAGPVSLLKCFHKWYWGFLITFCGFSKFCHVIWSAMCSFGSWDTVKNNLLLEKPINLLLSRIMDNLWKGLSVHPLGKPLYF